MSEHLEKKVKEIEFKLKKLENFLFEHHHRMDEIDNLGYETKHETSKPKVWVEYPNGYREEPKDER